ncbi:unnamed protein product, partial [marine sediment metagenome]
MPKLLGPLFSFLAEGNLGKTLNYCRRGSLSLVRAIHKPYIRLTPALKNIQGFMRHSVWTWQHLSDNIPPLWNDWAKDYYKHTAGFQAFTSYYMRDLSRE